MISDITIGQYFPGNSLLHRLDPRTKILLTILYIVTVFLAKSITAFALLILFNLFLILISGIPFRVIWKSIKPLLFVIALTSIINVFWSSGEHLLLSFWIIHIYWEGIIYAFLMVVRIVSLLVGTCIILTYTTSPFALTDGIERLLAPLKVFHIHVHDFSMIMTIALRFIPTLISETDKIMNAQKARGADFANGSLLRRAKALIPVLIPLFISSFRHADELAVAMECRCYHGGEGRTRMTVRHMSAIDWVSLAAIVTVGAVLLLLNRYFPLYSV